jgi:hypothetical protein
MTSPVVASLVSTAMTAAAVTTGMTATAMAAATVATTTFAPWNVGRQCQRPDCNSYWQNPRQLAFHSVLPDEPIVGNVNPKTFKLQ